MTQCKISVIMPVYNVEKYLRTCLESVVHQTLQEIEVIIINDGSTDGSLEILKEYETNYPNLIRVYTTQNYGVSHARNYGIKKATGEYVMFVDSDDLLELNMCELLYQKAIQNNNDVVICRYYDLYENEVTNEIRRKRSKAYEIMIGRDFDIHKTKFELIHISPFPWDKLYRRSLFDHYQFPENLRFEDLSIMYCVMTETNSIGVIEDRLYNYRRASSGSFLSNFSEGTLDIIEALELFVERMKKENRFQEFYEEIEYICTRHILIRYNAIFDAATKGKLDIKRTMIHRSMDFLDQEFPKWRENRYLKYSSTASSRMKIKKYTSKEQMLKTAMVREYTPVRVAMRIKKTKKIKKKLKDRTRKFLKTKNKIRYVTNRIPGIKLIKMPKDVRYTRYYVKYPVVSKDVLFESKHGEDVAGNIFQMILVMQEDDFRDFHVMLTLKEDKMGYYSRLFANYGINNVDMIATDSKEYLKALATAQYLITDTSLPTYYIKRKEQIYLNTWHGTPLKAMGRIVPKREYALGNVQRNFFLADYLLYQNEFARDIFIRDYMLAPLFTGKIMMSGYPRNSAFFNEERYDIIRAELGIEEMQVMAYMPTWRGLLNKKENKKQIAELTNYFYQLDDMLSDDQIIFVKLHPFVKSAINYDEFEHLVPFPEEYETYDFLNATDGLITDYSSIMFDYAVSKKKIILFTYDREDYLNNRGMYLDLEKLEFPIADTVGELVSAISKESSYPGFYEKFCHYDSENTAKEVCEALFLHKSPSFPIETMKADTKKKVLVIINGLRNGAKSAALLERLHEIDSSEYTVYLGMKSASVKKGSAMLSNLKDEYGYIPFMFDVNYTIWDRLACLWTFKFGFTSKRTENLINELAKREKDKYLGSNVFDVVINLSSPDKIIYHMGQAFEGISVYNFKSFNRKKYEVNKKYKKRVDYFIKRFEYYDYVVGNEDVTEFSCKAFEENKTKLLIDDAPKLDFVKVLSEVTSK